MAKKMGLNRAPIEFQTFYFFHVLVVPPNVKCEGENWPFRGKCQSRHNVRLWANPRNGSRDPVSANSIVNVSEIKHLRITFTCIESRFFRKRLFKGEGWVKKIDTVEYSLYVIYISPPPFTFPSVILYQKANFLTPHLGENHGPQQG